ncbi:hypothetical protein L916_08077 [Phytophthora nicotianae]|uniref:Uncharacterized protein n=1 Tax=Phytophthora nicotianae TaxID=4792 RepID=W2J526_PHYNI|nr:hypothetical protein L916_08077 [Phytophthora nicotianae]
MMIHSVKEEYLTTEIVASSPPKLLCKLHTRFALDCRLAEGVLR